MPSNLIIDDDYVSLINDLKQHVKTAQVKAHWAVNIKLIKLYWNIEKVLLEHQKIEAWGSKYLEQVSLDIRASFPMMKGLSTTNLKRTRLFAIKYFDIEFGAQAVP